MVEADLQVPRAVSQRWRAIAAPVILAVSVTTLSAQGQEASGAAVPAPVLNAFRQSYPTATVTAAAQTNDGNRTAYRVESTDKGRRRVVLYGQNNAVIEVAEQVDEKELPPPVAAAMHSHPRAIFASATKVTRDRNVQYHLTIKGTRKTAMIVKLDGTVVDFR